VARRRDLPEHVRASIAKIGEQLAHKPRPTSPSPSPTESRDCPANPIRLELPSPPSANRYWRVPKALGRPILSREARDYCARVKALAFAQGARSPLTGEVAVSIVWTRERRSGDLDGRLKIVLDALQGAAYVNDSQIVAIDARRQDRDKGEPGLVVEVRAA